ncbi:MAG TPA: hypothetical protein VFC35_07190 [Gemmatimonadaceae bacterium]|nr:hypothetical protein [Gemmatimonadaceae bacterium]
MKRFALTLSLVAATAIAAAPLAAQSSNGPWWDPGRTQPQTSGQTSGRNGNVYGNNGSVYGRGNTQQQADGVWRADSRDRNGNTIYVRMRYDSNGNLVREYATRNIIGRYNVIDRQVLSNGNNNGAYGNRGTYGNQGQYGRRSNQNSNDRWDQNNGHDNGKHNGQYKNKNKNRQNDRDRNDR